LKISFEEKKEKGALGDCEIFFDGFLRIFLGRNLKILFENEDVTVFDGIYSKEEGDNTKNLR
jgi:hypothetical protein